MAGLVVLVNRLFLVTSLFAISSNVALALGENSSVEEEHSPPVLSRIVRVNRGPSISSSSDEDATLHLKSPVYQLRFRPNRLSQFHGYSTLGGQPGPRAGFLNGIASHPPQHHNPQAAAATMDIDESLSGEHQQPTFTPFIGARALSNMGKFFEHLRENIEALKGGDGDGELDNERLLANKVNGEESKGFDWNWDESSEFPSDFSFQHFNEANSASAPLTIKWQPPASGFLHRNNRVSSSQYINDAEFKRPKFNPSWVKMGLGRRR